MNIQDILTQSGLDFTIEKLPLVATRNQLCMGIGGELETIEKTVSTPYFGLMNSKSGEVIHTVKKGYTVSQNKEVVTAIMNGANQFGELSFYKGGSLHGGRRIFIQLAIDGNNKFGNDEIRRYITIIDSNDGSTGLSVGIGDKTMSCMNQFFSFYKEGTMKMRHSVSLLSKIAEMPKLIELALGESLAQINLYKDLESTPISRSLTHKLVNTLLGVDRTATAKELNDLSTQSYNKMNTLYASIDREINSKGLNLWGLHSGTTHFTTHENRAPKRENGKLESLMLGTNGKMNRKSLEFVTKFAY